MIEYDGTFTSIAKRDENILELRMFGLTFKEIGKMLNINPTRARERYLSAKDRELRRLRDVKPNTRALAFWI